MSAVGFASTNKVEKPKKTPKGGIKTPQQQQLNSECRERWLERWTGKYGDCIELATQSQFKGYWEEWEKSNIHPEVIELNLVPIAPGDDSIYEWLVPNPTGYTGRKPSQPDAQWRQIRERLGKSWERGGWYTQSLDPSNEQPIHLLHKETGEILGSGWGCYKPMKPRKAQSENGKIRTVKYEHPFGCKTRPFFLKVPLSIWEKIAQNNKVPMPANPNATTFWQWVQDNGVEVWITEGAKKAAALLSQGIAAIALPGVYNGFRKKGKERVMVDELKLFTKIERSIVICFDHENKIIKYDAWRNVNNAAWKLGTLCLEEMEALANGDQPCLASVKVAIIPPGDEKGVDDFLFWQGEEAFGQLRNNLLGLQVFKELITREAYHELTRREGEIWEERDERYLSQIDLEGAKALLLKSETNTGKTEQIARLVQNHLDKGYPVGVIAHRNELVDHLVDRFNLKVTTLEGGRVFMFSNCVGLCTDSLHSKSSFKIDENTYKPEDNLLLIVDECEQVLYHTLFSTTAVKNNRAEVLYNLSAIAQSIFQSQHGSVVASDANLTDITGDFFRDIGGRDLPVKTIVNKHRPCKGKRKLYLYKDETSLFSQLIRDMRECLARKSRGEKHRSIAVYTQSQKSKSQFAAKNIIRKAKALFPKLKSLLSDAVAVADPQDKAFGLAQDPNRYFESVSVEGKEEKISQAVESRLQQEQLELLESLDVQRQRWDDVRKKIEDEVRKEIEAGEQEQVDLFVFTPVIETGVSIDVRGVFWKQYCFVAGVSTPSSARQGGARDREDCERHIYAPQFGLNYVGNKYLTHKKAVIKNIDFKLRTALTCCEWDGDDLSEPQMAAAYRRSKAYLELYSKLAARTNQESCYYWDYLEKGYRDEGYEVFIVEGEKTEEITDLKKELKENRDESYSEEIHETLAQKPYESIAEYEQSKKSERKTARQRLREKKHETGVRYGGLPVTEEIIRADDDGFTKKLKTQYYLLEAREECKARDRRHIQYEVEKAKNFSLFAPDVAKGANSTTVELLDKLGIPSLLPNLYVIEIGLRQLNEAKNNAAITKAKNKPQINNSLEKSQKLKDDLASAQAEAYRLECESITASYERKREIYVEFSQLQTEIENYKEAIKSDPRVKAREELRKERSNSLDAVRSVRENLKPFAFNNKSPQLTDIYEKVMAYRDDIQNLLGITLRKEVPIKKDGEIAGYREVTPIEIVKPLLNKIGVSLESIARDGSEGDRVRQYVPVLQHLNTGLAKEIFAAWKLREQEKRAEMYANDEMI